MNPGTHGTAHVGARWFDTTGFESATVCAVDGPGI